MLPLQIFPVIYCGIVSISKFSDIKQQHFICLWILWLRIQTEAGLFLLHIQLNGNWSAWYDLSAWLGPPDNMAAVGWLGSYRAAHDSEHKHSHEQDESFIGPFPPSLRGEVTQHHFCLILLIEIQYLEVGSLGG